MTRDPHAGRQRLEAFLDAGPARPCPVDRGGAAAAFGVGKPAIPAGQAAIPVPPALAHRPRDRRGYLVPFFVAYLDAEPDFRCADPLKLIACVRDRLCWLCGGPLGDSSLTFVIGPMCGINRVSSEPPSHLDCARYAVRACPFLSAPRMRRNEKDLPDGISSPAGEFLTRNPGATLLWTTPSCRILRMDDGVLFRLGDPDAVEWWCEGRHATRAEVEASVDSGLPSLRAPAEAQGPMALRLLDQMVGTFRRLLDASFPPEVVR